MPALSQKRPTCTAARMPLGMPTSSENAMATTASSSEYGSRIQIQVEHRRLVIERLPEIAAEQADHEQPVLRPERLIQAELLMNGGDILLAGAGFHQQAPPDRR